MNLKQYIESEIIPRYDHFDTAHQRNHVEKVIAESLNLANHFDVDREMVYVIAAFHDTGLCEGRDLHHMVSGRIIRKEKQLRQWFDEDQIETMAQAAEDHRASSKNEPRSIYGKIVAEADRDIVPLTIVRRTLQYGLSHYPEMSEEEQYQRCLSHLKEKYAEGGYMKLWIPQSSNAARLQELRDLIKDEKQLRIEYNRILKEETNKQVSD